ncbi:MAG: amidohydrolase family protein [Verrucomicrobia bacterium]|jgi:uncharacterized protein|nr:amidohydrolase family protein [Verrucomicrobiota bacterium]
MCAHKSWHDALLNAPILDVHEHHIPKVYLSAKVNLLALFQQSYAGWTIERPYPLPCEGREESPMVSTLKPFGWESLSPYLDERGSNSFVRNLSQGILALHGDPNWKEINCSNWEMLNKCIIESRTERRFHSNSLSQANVSKVITDDYTNPLLNASETLGAQYRSVMRINAFALGWHPESKDHNGNSATSLLNHAGFIPETFDDYLIAIRGLAEQMDSRGQVAFKNALAYDRSIDFQAPNKALAKQAWGKRNPSEEERLAFGDYVVDFICRLGAEMDIPIQMHLGSAVIRGSHPMHVAALIERHPRTRFLLMHLAYPWSRDLLGMAFVYRNIWIDLTWSWLLSPSHFKLALHEAIEILPDEGRMMLGGDNWHIEETVGTLQNFKSLMIEVLSEKVSSGYLQEDQSLKLGQKILSQNAEAFFRL